MDKRFLLPLAIAGLLMSGRPFAWAQVDTSEGGGEQFEQQEYGTSAAKGEPTYESLRAQIAKEEIANIKEQMRLLELIDANRRKLIELENRIRALESLHEKKGELKAKDPAGSDNGRGEADANKASLARPAAQPASAAKNDRWRYRRFQGRWWYWTPEGRWVYWTGERWNASAAPKTARR